MSAAFAARPAAGALLVVVGVLLSSAPAQAEPVWVEGTIQETNISSCIGGDAENGTGAFLAYQEPGPDTPPQVGDVYYLAVTVAGLGDTCSGTIYNPQVKLPPGTEPAVSGEDPVYCFSTPAKNEPLQLTDGMCAGIEVLADGNVQIDSASTWAGEFDGIPIAPFFPIAQGYFEEENFPVVSTTPLSGAQKIEADIYTTDEGGQSLYPWVAPVVAAGEEGIGGASGGETPGTGSPGGEPPGRGGSPGGGSPGDSGSGGGSPSAGNGSPGAEAGGGGERPTAGVPGPKLGKPKINSSKRTATFAFHAAAGVGGVRFRCSLDTKPFRPCRSPQTYRGLKKGEHSFGVEALTTSVASSPVKANFRIR